MAKRKKLLVEQLRSGLISDLHEAVEIRLKNYWKIEGFLKIETKLVKVTILIPSSVRELRQNPPLVKCWESFMKNGAEWHNTTELGMCWVLHEQWRDYMGWKGKPPSLLVLEARKWIIAGAASLIWRHKTATKRGLERWPAEWNQWPHFEEGPKQYYKEKYGTIG